MNKRKQAKEAYRAVLDEISNQHEVLETLIAYLSYELGSQNARNLIEKLNTKGNKHETN